MQAEKEGLPMWEMMRLISSSGRSQIFIDSLVYCEILTGLCLIAKSEGCT